MISIRVNGEKKLIPACWEEVTTEQFQKLLTAWNREDILSCFNILANTDIVDVDQTDDASLSLAIYQCVAFVWNSQPDFRDDKPTETLTVDSVVYNVPVKITNATMAQHLHILNALRKGKFVEENVSLAAAIYLQPQGQKFDLDKALELKKKLDNMPAYLVYPVGFFFLSKLSIIGTFGLPSLRQIKIILTKNVKRFQKQLKLKSLSPLKV